MESVMLALAQINRGNMFDTSYFTTSIFNKWTNTAEKMQLKIILKMSPNCVATHPHKKDVQLNLNLH